MSSTRYNRMGARPTKTSRFAGLLALGFGVMASCLDLIGAESGTAKLTDLRGLALFTQQVRPILESKCVECHGGKATKHGLDLTTREGLLHGGDGGPAIVPGKPSESLLYRRIIHADEPGMPYKREKLSADQIARIGDWINAGAPFDQQLVKGASGTDQTWWSLEPVKKVALPQVKDQSWVRTPIDQFILAKLEEKELKPGPRADNRTLLRRVYFDLIGLPPTPEEMESFL